MAKNHKEKLRPMRNLPPGPFFLGKIRFVLKNLFDLQVKSVLLKLVPWLSNLRGSILEVGCGAQPYQQYISSTCKYYGLENSYPSATFHLSEKLVLYGGGRFPFRAL